MKNIIIMVIVLLLSSLLNFSKAQITRGAFPGELYLSTDWYMDNNGDIHFGIFHSENNGATITLQYESSTATPSNEMMVNSVLGDATQGALYNIGGGELWVSFDYGINWEEQENYTYASFASGFSNGEIYRRSNYNLYRSEDYGYNFELIVESLTEPLSDVGNQNGQLFGFTGSAGVEYKLYHSLNYGNNFNFIPIDSSVAFWAPSGQFPKISRGTNIAEIYIVSWWLNSNYKIFYSADTGYTWTEKFESDYIDLFYWRVTYTAGRVPGSLYVMRSRINDSGDHVWLYIDYSSDYGETFTTYFHDLDSLFTTIPDNYFKVIKLTAYPNPFIGTTQIWFKLENKSSVTINVFDYAGKLIRSLNPGIIDKGTNHVEFSAKGLSSGIYFYSMEVNGIKTDTKKMTIIN